MKSTGIVRSIDKMGRIVLPMETRKLLSLTEEGSAVEIYTDNDMVILKKYTPACLPSIIKRLRSGRQCLEADK